MSSQILHYIADFLSIITIAMCLVLKVPQISKLLESKSAKGISFVSLLLELTRYEIFNLILKQFHLHKFKKCVYIFFGCSYSVVSCYNFTNGYSMLSYVEYPIILIQEYILIYLVLKYLNLLNSQTLLAVIVYFLICAGLLTQIIPKTVLTILVVRYFLKLIVIVQTKVTLTIMTK